VEDREGLSSAAEALRALHHAAAPLVLANCWDAATARVVQDAAFPAVATSSAAVAAAEGYPDDDTMPPDVAFAAVRRISRAVSVPVTADLEAGYRLGPDEFVQRLLAAGAVGCNLEDTDHHGAGVLVDVGEQADRLAGIREAADGMGVRVVLNARIDVFLRGPGTPAEQVERAIRRGRRYLEAGADCVYPIGLVDVDQIRAVVEGVGGPVNIWYRPGAPPLAVLGEVGVARVSVGSGLYRQGMRAVREAAEALGARGAPPG
jgi:2-methylisocitrate lyase-like PEP mutase family enzyme